MRQNWCEIIHLFFFLQYDLSYNMARNSGHQKIGLKLLASSPVKIRVILFFSQIDLPPSYHADYQLVAALSVLTVADLMSVCNTSL